jgi:hypothetical protein
MANTKKTKQAPLFPGSGPISTEEEFEEQLRLLMAQLGIDAVPEHSLLQVRTSRISIPGRDHPDVVREAERLAKTIAIPGVGVMQAPGIAIAADSPTDDPDDPACTFRIIWGRRRTVGSEIAAKKWSRPDLEVVTCKVYLARYTEALGSFLAFIENTMRELSWRKDVADLATLIQERVGMSEDDLVKRYGVARNVAREYLRFARLPEPLRRQITDGGMTKETAKKLTNLKKDSLAYLAGRAEAGEEITFEMASEAYVAQVNTGLAEASSLQRALALDVTAYFDGGSGGTGSPAELAASNGHERRQSPGVEGTLAALDAMEAESPPPYVREAVEALRQALVTWQQERCLAAAASA